MSETPENPPVAAIPSLTFDWSRKTLGLRFRFLVFLAVAVVGHALFFYLFKVVTPGASRVIPPARSVAIIPGKNPQAAPLMGKLDSKSLLPPSLAGARTDHGLVLEVPRYLASYENYAPKLLAYEMPGKEPVVQMFSPEVPLLPELPGSQRPVAPNPPTTIMEPYLLELGPKLAGRGIVRAPVWPKPEPLPEESDELGIGSLSLVVAVEPSGRVVHCMALRWENLEATDTLRKAVASMRFAPHSLSGTVWDTIQVRW